MAAYIVRRLLQAVLLLFVVSGLSFIMFFALPSADPAALRAGRSPSPELIATIRHNLGLDKSVPVQYWDYMKRLVLHADLGYSYQNDTSVKAGILERLPATISLTFGAAIVWLAAGISIGIISAVKHRSVLDRVTMIIALVGISAPVYWLGLLALFLFADDIGRIPLFYGAGSYVPFSQDPYTWFQSLLLPWLVLAAAFAAIYARLLRGSLLDVLHEDYIRTARAKGLSERRVIVRHGVRSAITPIVTAAGLDIGTLLGGAILTETVFNIPGVGRYVYEAIQRADLPVIQGVVIFGTFFIVMANLAVDVLYAFIDPRVRY